MVRTLNNLLEKVGKMMFTNNQPIDRLRQPVRDLDKAGAQ